jgi:S-adenosylmethionine synthetase
MGAGASEVFDLRPGLIIQKLDLLRPIYRKMACLNHFGRKDPDFIREKMDAAETLRSRLSNS